MCNREFGNVRILIGLYLIQEEYSELLSLLHNFWLDWSMSSYLSHDTMVPWSLQLDRVYNLDLLVNR